MAMMITKEIFKPEEEKFKMVNQCSLTVKKLVII
jgi:hypothetical protein